jgi:hypothetical protein
MNMKIINKLKCYDIDDAILMTPKMASALLSKNKCAKKIDKARVEKIESDLYSDNFKFNGATISLDSDGNLVDGQVRLTACVNTGISFKTLIVWGVDIKGQYTTDTGRARNVVQLIAKKGYKHPKALYQCSLILNGILTADDDSDGIKEKYESNVSNKEILDIIESTPDLTTSVNLIMDNKQKYLITTLYHLIILDYLCRFIDKKPKIANEFLDVLSNKIPAGSTHPVVMFRNIVTNSLQTRTEMSKKKQLALLIKSYNLLKQNLSCNSLHWTSSKKIPEIHMLSGN